MAIDVATDIESLIDSVEALLARVRQELDATVASCLCKCSRYIHLDVWRYQRSCERVKEEFIPLLHRVQQAVLELVIRLAVSGRLTKRTAKDLAQYAKNVGLRIQNLQSNYLEGKPSDFAPDERYPRATAQPPH